MVSTWMGDHSSGETWPPKKLLRQKKKKSHDTVPHMQGRIQMLQKSSGFQSTIHIYLHSVKVHIFCYILYYYYTVGRGTDM